MEFSNGEEMIFEKAEKLYKEIEEKYSKSMSNYEYNISKISNDIETKRLSKY